MLKFRYLFNQSPKILLFLETASFWAKNIEKIIKGDPSTTIRIALEKLLSTKVYWSRPEDRESYKKFWNAYKNSKSSEEKEILSLKRELYDTKDDLEKNAKIREFYKNKLVELGAMRAVKNKCNTLNKKLYKLNSKK